MSEPPIRVLVLDDDVGFATLAAAGLAARGIEVVHVASTLEEAAALATRDRPDVLIADIDLGRGLALGLPRLLAEDAPPILWFSGHDERYRTQACRAGGAGYVSKRESPDELVAAIRRITAGEVTWTQEDLRAARRVLKPPSDREIEVLVLIGLGRANKEIASELGISTRGVESAVRRMLDRYGLSNRIELANLARLEGWV